VGGRPRRALSDEEKTLLRQLASIGCTYPEAAGCMGMTPVAFASMMQTRPDLRRIWDEGAAVGKTALRRTQIRLAENGSAAAAIFLGKNWLGQRDVQVSEHTGTIELTHASALDKICSLLDDLAQREGETGVPGETKPG
jgi:hypothetical protein